MVCRKDRCLLLALIFFCFAIPAWAEGTNSQVVRVGVFPLEPVVFQDENGKAAGIYPDILAEIGKQEEWQIEYVMGSWAEGLSRLKAGEIDLVTSVAYSPQRDEWFDFSNESVLNIWGEVYVRPRSTVQNLLDLEGATIAVMKGDINGLNFKKLAESFQLHCTYLELSSHHDVLEWVENGKADGGVVPNVFGTFHAHAMGLIKTSIIFDAFSIYFAAAEGKNLHLLATIDNYLNRWKPKRNSPYYRILDHWLSGGRTQPLVPTWLLWFLAVSIVASLLFALWVKTLKHQVASRTRELKENEERYRGIFNSTTDPIFIHDADSGAILDVNESGEQMFGYSRFEMLQLSVGQLSLGEPSILGRGGQHHGAGSCQGRAAALFLAEPSKRWQPLLV
mgnify:CR=1 FL=1